MIWLWIVLGLFGLAALGLYAFHRHIFRTYIPFAMRAFQERPLFIPPTGQRVPDAEDVELSSSAGVVLKGCYLPARMTRKGVILFGLEFGSNRWACIPYCDFLRDQGFDIFSFEMRGQGESKAQPDYQPLQWVTQYEADDFRAALAYLKARPDADPRGVGFFGISKGASAGLFVAAEDPYVRCFATDGTFSAFTTMVPYMQRWILIYATRKWVAHVLPRWYYGYAARTTLRLVERERGCSFTALEKRMHRLAPRPLLMIHGAGDNYIKPEMAQALYERARQPKEFWLVEKAKHNQALDVAGEEYRRRVLAFFQQHLAQESPAQGQGPPENPEPARVAIPS